MSIGEFSKHTRRRRRDTVKLVQTWYTGVPHNNITLRRSELQFLCETDGCVLAYYGNIIRVTRSLLKDSNKKFKCLSYADYNYLQEKARGTDFGKRFYCRTALYSAQ